MILRELNELTTDIDKIMVIERKIANYTDLDRLDIKNKLLEKKVICISALTDALVVTVE